MMNREELILIALYFGSILLGGAVALILEFIK